MILRRLLTVGCLLALIGCEQRPVGAVGQLVSDRIEITAEFGEPIVDIDVVEGDIVGAG